MNSVNDVLFRSYSVDVGLLVFRLFFGVTMALAHGLPKLQRFAEIHATFPDPLGIGSSASLGMAIFAEIACALVWQPAFVSGLHLCRLSSLCL